MGMDGQTVGHRAGRATRAGKASKMRHSKPLSRDTVGVSLSGVPDNRLEWPEKGRDYRTFAESRPLLFG